MSTAPAMRCAGCGAATLAGESMPFRCPSATPSDEIDHVLVPVLSPSGMALPRDEPGNPFLRFRRLLYSHAVAQFGGLDERAYEALVRRLDEAVADVDGRGFVRTPYTVQPGLADAIGLAGVWVKDETGNVSGSHKARHLMGTAVNLLVAEAAALGVDKEAPLAIASCGNAALAAAVVARAANRALRVFVPPSANERVVERLRQLGAELVMCERRDTDPAGDPCYLRFLEAVDAGALPFACQGNQNGLTIEGGMTLGFELITQHAAGGWPPLDRIVIQVGGGAIASATIQALRWARDLGWIESMPAVHAVQTEAAHPVVDAWRRVVGVIESRVAADTAPAPGLRDDAGRAHWVAEHATPAIVAEVLRFAQTHRGDFMVPIQEPPRSIASGILDDETYDWHEVVRGMLETGGWPVIVGEQRLARARELGRQHTGIDVSATGASGFAGLLALAEADAVPATDRAAVLFTGVQR